MMGVNNFTDSIQSSNRIAFILGGRTMGDKVHGPKGNSPAR
jgi:hypothetical protein